MQKWDIPVQHWLLGKAFPWDILPWRNLPGNAPAGSQRLSKPNQTQMGNKEVVTALCWDVKGLLQVLDHGHLPPYLLGTPHPSLSTRFTSISWGIPYPPPSHGEPISTSFSWGSLIYPYLLTDTRSNSISWGPHLHPYLLGDPVSTPISWGDPPSTSTSWGPHFHFYLMGDPRSTSTSWRPHIHPHLLGDPKSPPVHLTGFPRTSHDSILDILLSQNKAQRTEPAQRKELQHNIPL